MFQYRFLPGDAPIDLPERWTRFKCLILIERAVPDAYRDAISAALIDAGCLFAMTWGHDCSLWEDSIDWAFIDRHPDVRSVPDDQYVLTTCHPEDTLAEVIEFAKHASQPNAALDGLLLLDFSAIPRKEKLARLYDAA